jgi:adenylylsulfate kinase-like enzyme
LPSYGKTSFARIFSKELHKLDSHVEVIDGEEVRLRLLKGFGFSKENRDRNLKRISFVTNLVKTCGEDDTNPAISDYLQIRNEATGEIVSLYDAYRDQGKDLVKDSIVEGHCHFHHYGSRLRYHEKGRYSCSNWAY